MSIATAITNLTNTIRALATTKGQIKSAVNTDIDFIANEQIESYPSLIRTAINRYKSYIPVVSDTAKQVSLNTVPLKVKEFAILGDTYQERYQGYNLANFKACESYPVTNGTVDVTAKTASFTARFYFDTITLQPRNIHILI